MKCEESVKCDWLRIRVMWWAQYGTVVGGVKSSKPTRVEYVWIFGGAVDWVNYSAQTDHHQEAIRHLLRLA